MALFYVAYDLDRPGQDYPELWEELESLGAQRVQESVWVLKSNKKTVELRDTLKRHIDQNDRILIIKSSFWAAQRNMTNVNKL